MTEAKRLRVVIAQFLAVKVAGQALVWCSNTSGGRLSSGDRLIIRHSPVLAPRWGSGKENGTHPEQRVWYS